MNIIVNKKSYRQFVLYALFILFGLLIPQISMLSFFITILLLFFSANIRFTYLHILLFFSTIFYYLLYTSTPIVDILDIKNINNFLLINLGYYIASNQILYTSKEANILPVNYIMMSFLGMSLFAVLGTWMMYNDAKHILFMQRLFYNFWNNQLVDSPFLSVIISVYIGTFFSIFYSIISMLKVNKDDFIKYLLLLIVLSLFFLGDLIVSILFSNRSVFIIAVFSFIFVNSIYLFNLGNKDSIKILFKVIILLIPFLLYMYSSFDTDFLNMSNLVDRFQSKGIDSPRYLLWIDGIEKSILNPFGGFKPDSNIDKVPYFHNYWLDTARFVGIFPVIGILVFQGIHFYYLIKLKNYISIQNYSIYSSMFLSFILISMIEPVQESSPNFIILMFVYLGFLKSTYRYYTEKGKNKE